jgi:hypothetical protein
VQRELSSCKAQKTCNTSFSIYALNATKIRSSILVTILLEAKNKVITESVKGHNTLEISMFLHAYLLSPL